MKHPLHSRYEGFYLVPLAFSSEMVRANCDGLKRMTCRPLSSPILRNAQKALADDLIVMGWVREAWTADYLRQDGKVCGYFDLDRKQRTAAELMRTRYRADAELVGQENAHRWVPAMHMPFDRHRMFMRITSIETFLLGDMTEEDALSEGMAACAGREKYGFDDSACSLFQQVWTEAYGGYSPEQEVLRVRYERPIAGPVTSFIQIHQEIAA